MSPSALGRKVWCAPALMFGLVACSLGGGSSPGQPVQQIRTPADDCYGDALPEGAAWYRVVSL